MRLAALVVVGTVAASCAVRVAPVHVVSPRAASPCMMGAKRKKAPGKRSAPSKISPRGFGAKAVNAGTVLSDPTYDAMYEWLRTSSKTNLNKVAVADFDGLRGVMATEDIGVGEDIVSIPAEFAVDLGTQNQDPVPTARRLLYEKAVDDGSRAAYWELLPQPNSPDLCTADFMSEKELMMLQWPPLVVETRKRSAQLREVMGDAAPSVNTPREHLSAAAGRLKELRWATWIVLSRVLTVVGPDGQGHKLLIPFIDMFNHRASSKHYLTGRTDGALRVVAGEKVRAGEQIHIVYGTEATSNVELLAHYGFVDPSAASADRALVRAHPDALAALRLTSVEEDLALLQAEP